jgi:hypothetical protein
MAGRALEVAGDSGAINGCRRGKWLAKHQGRDIEGKRIINAGDRGPVATWKIDAMTTYRPTKPT